MGFSIKVKGVYKMSFSKYLGGGTKIKKNSKKRAKKVTKILNFVAIILTHLDGIKSKHTQFFQNDPTKATKWANFKIFQCMQCANCNE